MKMFGFLVILFPALIFSQNIELISKNNYLLKQEDLDIYKNVFNLDSFIETGTYAGETTKIAAEVFSEVHSIEIHPKTHMKNVADLMKFSNIFLYLGDSTECLGEMIKKAHGNKLFWLDAHYCGESTGGTPGFSPLPQELEQIHTIGSAKDVILIDDIRGMYINCEITTQPLRNLAGIMKGFDPSYGFYVIGDIALCFNHNEYPGVSVSNLVKACTVSRLFDNRDESEESLRLLIESEKIIASTDPSSKEGQELIGLLFWCRGWEEFTHPNQIGGEVLYLYWNSLLEIEQKKYKEAIKKLQLISNSHYSHWRIFAHLARAYILDNQNEAAKSVYIENLFEQGMKFPQELEEILGAENFANMNPTSL